MRHFKLTAASLIAGAALTLSACGGGNSEANNTADNAMFGNDTNMVDPMAVETMNNGTDMNAGGAAGSTGSTGGSTAGNSAGTAGTTGNTTGATTGTGTGGTDAGGDTGGNAAGGTVNGM